MATTHVQCDRCLHMAHVEDNKGWTTLVVNTYPAVGLFRDLCPPCTNDLRDWFESADHVHDNPVLEPREDQEEE